MYTQKSSSLKIELTKTSQAPVNYQQQQAQIETQQLNHMMMAQQQAPAQQSATHFFASLLQNPAVLANPELMASVASMLQSSLANPAVGMAPIGSVYNMPVQQQQPSVYPTNGNCFRNFSIPNSESSSQLRSIIESSICGNSDHGTKSQRSNSINSSSGSLDETTSNKDGSNFSRSSSDQDSNTGDLSINQVDFSIKNFKNSNELVVNKVMNVVEEILANENIIKNNFLAKLFEVKPSIESKGRPEILIKRLAGFKRVKAITTEFKVVQAAIRESSMFDISRDELSAFRREVLPNLNAVFLQSAKSSVEQKIASPQAESITKSQADQKVVKKILAINFSQEEFTIEKMTQIFEQIGEIAQISLIRPGKKVPEYLSEYTQWVPDLGSKFCAVIDFESQDSAQNACREINMSNKVGSNIRCALLKPGARIKRTLYRKYNSTNSFEGDSSSSSSGSSSRNSSQTSNTSNNSKDSGLTSSSSKKQPNFNRKDVKKAISKHFISLGAYKNGTEATASIFVRQPKGPVSDEGCGFSGEYRKSRVVEC